MKAGINFGNNYGEMPLTSEYNWIEFTFIQFRIEWDKFDNTLNIEMALLGFWSRIWILLPGTTKQKEELFRRIKHEKA